MPVGVEGGRWKVGVVFVFVSDGCYNLMLYSNYLILYRVEVQSRHSKVPPTNMAGIIAKSKHVCVTGTSILCLFLQICAATTETETHQRLSISIEHLTNPNTTTIHSFILNERLKTYFPCIGDDSYYSLSPPGPLHEGEP